MKKSLVTLMLTVFALSSVAFAAGEEPAAPAVPQTMSAPKAEAPKKEMKKVKTKKKKGHKKEG